MVGNVVGWTARYNHGSDRPDYEADVLVCRHCGWTVFMCDAVTKKPLPATAVAERCGTCDKPICGRCKIKLNSGGICSYFRDRIDRMEEAAFRRERLGSYG